MRCLSIATEATKTDEVLFVTADDAFHEVIHNAGIAHHILYSEYSNMDAELEKLKDVVQDYRPSELFVDSYYVTNSYLSELKKFCNNLGCRIIYIDDVLAFPYSCDYLINYNIYGPDVEPDYKDLYENAEVKTPVFLLGSSFVPLRGEFQNLLERKVNKEVRNILVSTGGADPEHVALQLVKGVIQNEYPYTFHFILGSMNKDKPEIEIISDKHSNIVLHSNVNNMSSIMRACDVAISAAGSTLYELCATQTPTITYIFADNQIPGAEGFEKHGILHCAGDYRKNAELVHTLLYEVACLAENNCKREEIAQKMKAVVDGNGCRRILDILL